MTLQVLVSDFKCSLLFRDGFSEGGQQLFNRYLVHVNIDNEKQVLCLTN